MLQALLIFSIPPKINLYNDGVAKTLNIITTSQAISTQALPSTLAQQIAPPETIQRPDPNRDRLLPAPQPTLPKPEDTAPVLPPIAPPESIPPNLPTTPIAISKIQITGSTVFKPSDFAPLTQSFEGKTATLAELRGIADSITRLYLSKGYINSRAILGEQAIVNGIVEIRVIEGSVETIEVNGTQRLSQNYVRSRVQLGITTPLRQDKLEDQLRLLRADPILSDVEATLRPGTALGKSILSVHVREASPIYGGITADNYSTPSVGSERIGGFLGLRNLGGLGDEFVGSYNRSTTGGANTFDFNYRVPINPMNGTLQLRIAPSSNRITDRAFTRLFDITGNSDLYEVSIRQPLVRSTQQEFALSLGFALQNGNNLVTSSAFPDFRNASSNRVRVLKFSQDYLARDFQGAWALRSQFNFGLDVFNASAANQTDDPSFFSWLGQVQRIQRLGKSNLLIAQLDAQLSPNNLVPAQQFVIGGGQSVRGYRQNARSNDNGIRFSLEDRIAIARNAEDVPVLQLAPFIDLGAVWSAKRRPSENLDERFLSAGGIGLLWEPLTGLNIRLDYAIPFRSVSERRNNLQDKAVYFSVNYQL